MKKIFVTVAEFLENGGELQFERPIYGSNLLQTLIPAQVGEYDGASDNLDMIRLKQRNRSFPIYSNIQFQRN